MKSSVIVILGQTATGKTALAIKVAKKFNGEIISADSRQVYTGLDIGTDKVSVKDMRGIPHHLIDVVNPKRKFSVALFQKQANQKIKEIIERGNIPILCGGTGFYIDAITQGLVLPEVPPNVKLRKQLEKKSNEELFKMLKKVDKNRAKNIDQKNKVRLVRAIEIAKNLGKVPSIKTQKPEYKFIKIGLVLPPQTLEKNIKKRVKRMFRAGLLNEIRKLKQNGISNKRLREFGFEYYEPTKEKVLKGTINYAKRQMTWFKRDKEIKWFSPTEYKKIENYIKKKF